MNICLLGRSGSGKTTAAQHLSTKGFLPVSTGALTRRLCRDLYGDEDREHLNRLTDTILGVDQEFWVRITLQQISEHGRIVFDSARTPAEYDILRGRGFRMVRIVADKATRFARLAARGQQFRLTDDDHHTETSLDMHPADAVVVNNTDDMILFGGALSAALIELGGEAS